MKTIKLSAIAVLLSTAAFAQTNWSIDASHTRIGFNVTHMMVSEVNGKFTSFDGTVKSTKDDFTDSQIEFSVDINSVNTSDEKRDAHLKSADFFEAEKYPKMTFKSTSFKKIKDKQYKLKGDLTMKGVTKQIEFDVEYAGTVINPFTKASTAGFKLKGELNRVDYGLKWNFAIETGGVMVSETVKIDCSLEIIKK